MNILSEADLIINPDGSIYHLNLLPEDIAPTVITVGDPERVSEVSKYFDRIELRKGKREFITHTGYLSNKRITVISTGIGTDNIDIVLNELDALVNIDFKTRLVKSSLVSLDIIRIGTSGSIQKDIPLGTILASSHGLGLDTLMKYYYEENSIEDRCLLNKIKGHMAEFSGLDPYLTSGSKGLLERIAKGLQRGITVTSPGFYAPQGRKVRAINRFPRLIEKLNTFEYGGLRLSNLEMETAGIYALAKSLGHNALSINAILANRILMKFSDNPAQIVDQVIRQILQNIIA
ncbi:MAG: phosphorylase [Pedobacter sp.]|nr:phosphorylase [Pedobacter sp.]